jgi:hypothetical protein
MDLFKTPAGLKEAQEEIHTILQNAERVMIEPHQELSGVWFHSLDWETELRLLYLGRIQITISRVKLRHQRQGTMTAILRTLEAQCRQYQVRQIVVQSVTTDEMESWCSKNGFAPVSSTILVLDGHIRGDFCKQITES